MIRKFNRNDSFYIKYYPDGKYNYENGNFEDYSNRRPDDKFSGIKDNDVKNQKAMKSGDHDEFASNQYKSHEFQSNVHPSYEEFSREQKPTSDNVERILET